MKTFLWIVGLAVLVVIGAIIFLSMAGNGTEAPNTDLSDETDTDTEDTSVLAEEYVSSEFDFSIRHAADAAASVEAKTHTKFLKTGPDQSANTEVVDGYVVTVSAYDKAEYASLEALAEAQASSTAQVGDVLVDVTPTSFQGYEAFRFRSDTVGAPVHHVFVSSPEWYYGLSYSVAGDEEGMYQAEVNAMLRSFTPSGGFSGTMSDVSVYEEVQIALLDTDTGDGDVERGCDRVVMVPRSVAPTTMPLTAALEALFSLENERVDGWFNFMARTNDTLSFDRAEVAEGTASVYLTGEVSGFAGVCDNPRPMIQIEETALQFETVDEVVIYLNGEETDLQPDMQGS